MRGQSSENSNQDENNNTSSNYDYDFRILHEPLEDALDGIQLSLEQLVYQLRKYPAKKKKEDKEDKKDKKEEEKEKRCIVM